MSGKEKKKRGSLFAVKHHLLRRNGYGVISPDKSSHGDKCQKDKHKLTHTTSPFRHETPFESLV
jgi:hypothetical protein